MLTVGCARGRGLVTLQVSSAGPLPAVDHLTLVASNGMVTSQRVIFRFDPAPFSIPPTRTLSALFDASHLGTWHLDVTAEDVAGAVLARGSADGAGANAGGNTVVQVVLQAPSFNGDAGAGDALGADGSAPDQAPLPDGGVDLAQAATDDAGTPPDLAAPDLAVPDLAVPDLAVPDAAVPDAGASDDAAAVDLAMPDLATPDLVAPDLLTPDLALPDLFLPDDLLAPDLLTPDLLLPDLLTPDLAQPDLSSPPS